VEQRLQVLLDASVLQAIVAFMEKERSPRGKKISVSPRVDHTNLDVFLDPYRWFTREKPQTHGLT
jgi:hypothetical protein